MQQLSDQLFHKSIINTCLVDFSFLFICTNTKNGALRVYRYDMGALWFSLRLLRTCACCALTLPPSRNKNKIKTPSKPAALEKGICTNEAYRHASSVSVCICVPNHTVHITESITYCALPGQKEENVQLLDEAPGRMAHVTCGKPVRQ